MRTTAVIEIPHVPEHELPSDLLEAAYRASATMSIVLIVPPAMRPAVDRALDPLVATLGLTVDGVRYVAPFEERSVRTALASSSWVHVISDSLRSWCEASAVPHLGRTDALAKLRGRDGTVTRLPLPAEQSSTWGVTTAAN